MIPNSEGLLASKAHKAGQDVHRLLSVTVRQRVLDGIVRNALPHTVLLYVSHFSLIKIGLAHVVKERYDGQGFLGKLKAVFFTEARTLHKITQAFIDVQAMLQKSSLVCAVKPSACGSGKKVGFFRKILEKCFASLTSDTSAVDLHKFFSVRHNPFPFSSNRYTKYIITHRKEKINTPKRFL
jgi:hypothetical protein